MKYLNLLNVELNPNCHMLILLGYLTFMSTCIVSIFQYISNKMQSYTVYLYTETALHVSGGTSTHHQERIQLYLQHLVFVTPLLLSTVVVEELESVWVCCGWRTPPTAHCLIVMDLKFSLRFFEKILTCKISWKSFQWEPCWSMWTDGQIYRDRGGRK
jgi:hypothetical protein